MSQSAIEFKDGHSALLRDPEQVPVRLRRPYDRAKLAMSRHAVDVQEQTDDEAEQQKLFILKLSETPEVAEHIADAAVLALVAEWSYGPVTQEVLEDLPTSAYDELVKRCTELAPKMSPNFAVSDDPKATSKPSTGSVKSGSTATTTKRTSSR